MNNALILAFIAVLGASGIWAGVGILKKAKAIEPVAPITRHNTGLLPERETLVRGADIPPTHLHAELLRAAQGGKETSPEELLRATTSAEPTAD